MIIYYNDDSFFSLLFINQFSILSPLFFMLFIPLKYILDKNSISFYIKLTIKLILKGLKGFFSGKSSQDPASSSSSPPVAAHYAAREVLARHGKRLQTRVT
jgi:hypothetical protein